MKDAKVRAVELFSLLRSAIIFSSLAAYARQCRWSRHLRKFARAHLARMESRMAVMRHHMQVAVFESHVVRSGWLHKDDSHDEFQALGRSPVKGWMARKRPRLD